MPTRTVTSQLTEPLRAAAASVLLAVRVLRAYVGARMTPVLGEDGGEIASWVVVTALVVVASIAIVTIVVSKLTSTANNIQTP